MPLSYRQRLITLILFIGLGWLALTVAVASAQTVYVDGDQGVDTHDGTATAPYATLEKALRHPQVKEIILRGTVRPKGTVTITGRRIRIVGESAKPVAKAPEKSRKTSGNTGKIVGKVGGLGGQVLASVLWDDWVRDEEATKGKVLYQREASEEPPVLWQNEPVDALGMWSKLKKVETRAECVDEAGTWMFEDGRVTVHPLDGGDPGSTIEWPKNQFGLMAMFGELELENIHVRGAVVNGVNVYVGRLLATDCVMANNGFNGIGGTRGCGIRAVRCYGLSNNNDGFGLHNNAFGQFIDCVAKNNGDDGFSPHENCVMILRGCLSQGNMDRGVVAIEGATLIIEDSKIYDNGGQNFSLEGKDTRGYVDHVIAQNAGPEQPNARVINGAKLLMHAFEDKTGHPVQPVTPGHGVVHQTSPNPTASP